MLITAFLIFIVFLFYSWMVIHHKWDKIDDQFYKYLTIKEPFIFFFRVITNLASKYFFAVMSILLLLLMDNKKIVFIMIVGLIIYAFIMILVKKLIKRERPKINPLVKEKGYSYISGHTFGATFFYGFLCFLIFFSNILLPIKVGIMMFFLLLIFIIAFSRIYLGVHYLSDTIGGFLLGSCYLLFYLFFTFQYFLFFNC